MVAYRKKRVFRKKPFPVKKKTFRRRYASPRMMPFSGNPTSKVVKLRYCEEIALNSGTSLASASEHMFRANGMFDPQVAVGGHQPFGFDQQMAYYNHFTVIGSKCSVAWVPNSTSNIAPQYVAILLQPDQTSVATTYSNINHLLEAREISYGGRSLMNVGVVSGASYQGKKMPTIHKTFSSKKYFRRTTNTTTLSGTVAADPTEEAIYNIVAFSAGGADGGSIICLLTIDYIALLTEPRVLAQS